MNIINGNSKNSGTLLGWIIWSVAALYVLYQFLLQASISVMIPHLMKAFNINVLDIGFLSSSFFYTYILLQIPAGLLIDRVGARGLLSFSIFLCAAATLLFSLSHNLQTAEISRLIMGASTAPAVVGALYLGSNWFPPKRFAMIAGLTEMLGMLGGAIGEEVLAYSVDRVDWRATLFICAAVGVVLAVMALLIIRDRPKKGLIITEIAPPKANIFSSLKKIARCPQAWLNGFYAGLMFSIIQAFASLWAVPFLAKLYHLNGEWAAGGSSMIFLGTALGAPAMGWLSDGIGRRKPLMLWGAIATLFFSVIIIYGNNIPLGDMFILLFLLGFFCGAYILPFAVMREITSPTVRGAGMGFINMMAIAIGAPLLAPLAGWLLRLSEPGNITSAKIQYTINDYHTALVILPIALILAIVAALFIRETYCEELVEQ